MCHSSYFQDSGMDRITNPVPRLREYLGKLHYNKKY